ncbi:hypothetical protein AB0F91_06270 [Amycolatopsis sp. NPDC023774]|uniref:hypothetical protein n=1 Tax=Amycolatopsis sp. NPDC023774 TaxID=3155015 RepID=UPI003400265B
MRVAVGTLTSAPAASRLTRSPAALASSARGSSRASRARQAAGGAVADGCAGGAHGVEQPVGGLGQGLHVVDHTLVLRGQPGTHFGEDAEARTCRER